MKCISSLMLKKKKKKIMATYSDLIFHEDGVEMTLVLFLHMWFIRESVGVFFNTKTRILYLIIMSVIWWG